LVFAAVIAFWRPLTAWWQDEAGNRALLRGERADALAWFDRALVLEPHWSLLHEDRGRALLESDPSAALREFDRAACGAPCLAEAGDALARLGKPDEAIDRYIGAKAVSRVSDIALSLAERGEYDAAAALVSDLIRRLRDNFLERADLASAYATLGKVELGAATAQPKKARELRRVAIAAYASASRLAPYNEGYLLSYAFAQMQWGDADAARHAFERLLQLHPHQSDAESALAHLAGGQKATPPASP
jgi:tetratricopeptide (TPR) repeat protein